MLIPTAMRPNLLVDTDAARVCLFRGQSIALAPDNQRPDNSSKLSDIAPPGSGTWERSLSGARRAFHDGFMERLPKT